MLQGLTLHAHISTAVAGPVNICATLAMSNADLERHFVALRQAVRHKDRSAVQAALEAIDDAIAQADPLTRAAAYAQVQLERGLPLEAAKVLDDVMGAIGDDARVHFQIAQYKEQGDDLDGALESYARANTADARFGPAWVSRGVLFDRRGDPAAALECYRNALLADPQSVHAWRNLGNALAAQRKFSEAAAAYDTALGLAVGDPTIAFLRASAHGALGDLETANRLLPDTMRNELGELHEEVLDDRVCRFHATAEQLDRARKCAHQLLRDDDAAPFTVEHEGKLYRCDPDPIYSEHPHRFLDASTTIGSLLERG